MSSEAIAIHASGLGKTYTLYERPIDRLLQGLWRGRRQYGRQFAALAEVSFELRRGEVLGIVGRNGAGKSTLLQLVCNTLTPSSGHVVVNGRVAALLELGAGFNPDFTGRENVFMNAAILGLDDDEIRERYDEIVDFSGVRDFIDQPVKTYSSGMYVRLAFAIATSVDPDILIIDEALSVGDGAFARKSFDRIMALKDRGATILFCSHSTYHIEAICGRALWLEAGRVRMLDAAATVTAAYNSALALESGVGAVAGVTPDTAPKTSWVAPGTGRVVAVTAECDGQAGRRLKAHSRRSVLVISVEFASDPALPCPTVGLGIENDAGVGVTSAISLDRPEAVCRDAMGIGRATVSFPNLGLLKGTFHVTVFLGCERGLHVYDVAPRCLTIDVEQEGLLQGVAVIPHVWDRPHG
jgi:lipopolysaccharide transport system ATP-binding protein